VTASGRTTEVVEVLVKRIGYEGAMKQAAESWSVCSTGGQDLDGPLGSCITDKRKPAP
jgi:hypothetical protein